MHARSIAASARFLRMYSKSTPGRSAFVPRGPRIRHSRPWSLSWPDPTSKIGWKTTDRLPRLEQRVEKRRVRWHAMRLLHRTCHAEPRPGDRAVERVEWR